MKVAYPIFDLMGKSLKHYMEWDKISDDPQDFNMCVIRERFQEIEYAMKNNIAYFWDGERILDSNFKVIPELDKSKTYFPRTCVPSGGQKGLWNILKRVPNTIMTKSNYLQIRAWPLFMPYKYINRRMGIITRLCVNDNFLDSFEEDKIFIKSLEKGWHYVGEKSNGFEIFDYMNCHSNTEEQLIYSKFIDIDKDEHGTMEYRIYFIQGRYSISRYKDYEHLEIPGLILGIADLLELDVVGKVLPENIVIDVALVNGDPIVIECNSPCSSGRYIDNSVESLFGEVL